MAEFDITGETNLSASGGNNHLWASAAIQAALRMTHKVLPKAVTAGSNTVTETELKENGTIRCTGTPGGAVTLTLDNNMGETPADQDRRLIIQNALSDTSVITVDTVTGSATTPAINQDEVWLIVIDANEIVIALNLTSVGGGGGSVSVDDEGSEVVATASTFDFVGAGVTASDGGSDTATITVPGDIQIISGGGAWQTLQTQTPSGASQVDFVLPSGYFAYAVYARGVFDDDDTDLWLRVSTDGGSSFISTSSYKWSEMIFDNAGESHSGSASDTKVRLLLAVGTDTGEQFSLLPLIVIDPANTSNHTQIFSTGTFDASGGDHHGNFTSAKYLANTAVDAIRIQPDDSVGGTTITGTFVLLGLRSDPLDASEKPITEIDVAAGGTITLTDAQIRGADFFKLTGAPAGAFTLDVPDGDRRYRIWNASGQSATIDTVTGSTTKPTVANNERWEFDQDGVEIVAKHQLSAP